MTCRIKKLVSSILILNLLMLISSANWASASLSTPSQLNLTPEETQQVIDSLKYCDSGLEACKKAKDSQQVVVDKQNELLKSQERELSSLKNKSILESPILWFVVGLGVSAIVFNGK